LDASNWSVELIIFDDGSSDGTAEMIRREWPEASIISGKDCFWARAMSTAEDQAWSSGSDYVLWLNDDVTLDPNALTQLTTTGSDRDGPPPVIVGAVQDSSSGLTTYSGLKSRGPWRPLNPAWVEPSNQAAPIDLFNGNLVLVPRSAFVAVGGIDGEFAHGFADYDYGLRLTRARYPILLAAGTHGSCSRNPPMGTWKDPTLAFGRRFRDLLSRKGVPIRSLWRFVRRHSRWRAPVVVAWIYFRITSDILSRKAL
jgi:GT2 family glycosyltransferase